jgi:6-pyruvoyltetrahydropterin/6-carboxytetrahydropterin synthase
VYQLGLQRSFEARHFLVGGDWGDENRPHTHAYRIEWILAGSTLDRHGFLVDLVQVEARLDEVVERFRGMLLNDLPEFRGLNPSLEHFARILNDRLAASLGDSRPTSSEIRLWENDAAWASHRRT